MQRALRTVLILALPIAALAVWAHLFGAELAWARPIHWIGSAVLEAAALATVMAALRGNAGRQHAIAAVLLGLQLATIVATLAGAHLVERELFPSHRLAAIIAAALALAIGGIAMRRAWARWLGFALGAVGALSGLFNLVAYWRACGHASPEYAAWSADVLESAWLFAISALGGSLIAVNLAAQLPAAAVTPAWSSPHRLAGAVRALIVASFAAVPMLLVYAWLQPIVAATQPTAVVLAAALAAGSALAARGKVAGALLLVVAGAGLLVETAVTAARAAHPDLQIVGYYAVFWLPAGVLALVAGVQLARPVLRLLRPCRR